MILKIKKTVDEWIGLYVNAIRNRLRRDLNLSDVFDVQAARDNLGLSGVNNNTHSHDSRYLPLINNKVDQVKLELANSTITIDGDVRSSATLFQLGKNITISTSSVKAREGYIVNATTGKRYLALCDNATSSSFMKNNNHYIDVGGNKLCTTNIQCSSVYSSGDISANGDIRANRVFNAMWGDYAELMPRGEITEPGDIIMLDLKAKDEKYIKAYESNSPLVVAGIHSDEFGMLIGGENPVDGKNLLEYNIDKYIPVALSGRVHVKFIGKSEKGAKVVPSSEPGYGRLYNKNVDDPDTVIGYLVKSDDRTDKRKLKVRITR